METRINKYLSEVGFCSRREADKLLEQGRITINGKKPELGTKVSDADEICVDGKNIKKTEEKHVYIAFNKPIGIVCTTDTKREKNNIVDYINHPKRIFPIGRLDKPSEGLILLTSDGDIVNKILRARNNHEKEYAVAVNHPVTEEFLQKMREGVWIEDLAVKTKPCKAWKTGPYTFHIILTQGLNRQIRRMCEACGCHVRTLKRVRIMNIHLGNLKEGSFREITGEEYRTLLAQLEQSKSLSERDLRLKNK